MAIQFKHTAIAIGMALAVLSGQHLPQAWVLVVTASFTPWI